MRALKAKAISPTLSSATLLILFAFGTAAAQNGAPPDAVSPPPGASIYGQLAFSEAIVFDYDRDGTTDRVQFWIELKAQPAAGKPDSPGARPESGSVSYFVMDLDSGQRIDDWLLGFNMGGAMAGGFPVAGKEYPLTNIRVRGSTAQFDLTGSTWTIRDAGDSWEQDNIRITTGGREREGRFYGGNLTVIADPAIVTKPANIRENRRCNRCHEDAAVSVAAEGGPHAELECIECHAKHPPKTSPPPVRKCSGCHNPHADSMTMGSCVSCHSSHDIDHVQYSIFVPDEHCAACHEDSMIQVQASGTLHMGLACALCHRDEHGAIPSCTDCHGGPHPERVMARPERCVRCHDGGHETVGGR